MKKSQSTKNLLFIIVLASMSPILAGCSKSNENKTINPLWDSLAPYFEPPENFRGDTGGYSNLLRFEDGEPVRTSADWQRRKLELQGLWHDWMGHWPALLEDGQLSVLNSENRENFIQSTIELQWMPDEITTGYLLVPEGEGPHPAVVVVFYEPETGIGLGIENRDFALQLVRRGFVALSLGTSEASKANTFSLYYPSLENAQVEPLSMLAYAAANAWYALANDERVDPERIGIAGHSFGGKWAMFASCLFDNFAAAAWSDPGIVFNNERAYVNYWEPWYLGYHSPPWRERGLITEENPAFGLYPKLIKKGRDLHELHAMMAPRPFLVSGGSEDPPEQWRALNRTIEVNDLLGYQGRVGMTNRPDHSPNPTSNDQIVRFFEYFLLHRGIDQPNPNYNR